ncbi:MAG: sulfatase-like hydrolase/transferase [Planctomycetia bacterium]|nr:sulfatase-like hydrolase/transferase [Planctomycetia bacterium]
MKIGRPLVFVGAMLAASLPTIAVAQGARETREAPPGERQPNIFVIMADDLGSAELGCTGSDLIRTPNIDRLRKEGMLFTHGYSGACVCAPSRSTLVTGQHLGHTQIRDNGEIPNFDGLYGGQRGLLPGTETIGRVLRNAGYKTAAVGKWGLGGPNPDEIHGHPLYQGFGFWYGYLCQRNAHNYYPYYVWRNFEKVDLAGNDRSLEGEQYVPDLMADETLAWIEQNADDPMLLMYWTPVPHLALQVPPDSLQEYLDLDWNDPPYTGGAGYLPCDNPRARYAAMITRWDRDVGRIMDKLVELGLDEDTLIIVTSDNGATYSVGGYDPAFFNGSGGLRGAKGSLWEGGVRVPFIARWPGRIEPDTTSDFPVASWDLYPTALELGGATTTVELDGISIAPTLLGEPGQTPRNPLYWETPSGSGLQAVRDGDWKAVRLNAQSVPDGPIQLFNLVTDPNETTNIVDRHPEIARHLCELMTTMRSPSIYPEWTFCP